MSGTDRLGFGELRTSGRIVGINEVARGLNCESICPACRAPLVARQGTKRIWHFSHAAGQSACTSGAETGLHRMAKQIIAQWNAIDLPERTVTVIHKGTHGNRHHAETTLEGQRLLVRHGRMEATFKGFRPDVLLECNDGRCVAIEVRVSHLVDGEKQKRVADANLTMLEYDLSSLPRCGIDTPLLEAKLREMIPEWIHHPDEAEARHRLHLELQDRAAREAASPLGATKWAIPTSHLKSLAPSGASRMVFDPGRGLIQKGTNSPISPLIAEFRFMGIPIRIRSHELLDAIVVWACHSFQPTQEMALRLLARNAVGAGVTCSSHALYLGRFIAWGPGARNWALSVAESYGAQDALQPEELVPDTASAWKKRLEAEQPNRSSSR